MLKTESHMLTLKTGAAEAPGLPRLGAATRGRPGADAASPRFDCGAMT